nr:ankyrin repeat domain-containing protein [Pseudoxanthomonas sp. OG2]
MSASQWNRGAVELLVSAGSDVALQDAVGNTALHVASLYSKHSVSDGSASIMDILLAAGADPRATNFSGLTPLHIASSPEAIRLLVRAGADPNAVSVEGDNPLHYAVSPANVFALLEAGADPYKRNVQGRTPVEELQLRAACLADWQAPATALEKYLVATSLRSAGITDGKAFEVEAPRIRLRL